MAFTSQGLVLLVNITKKCFPSISCYQYVLHGHRVDNNRTVSWLKSLSEVPLTTYHCMLTMSLFSYSLAIFHSDF